MSGTWIQTHTGLRVNPFEMQPGDVDIKDISHALANLCRFTGHTRNFYSVAQHSVLVAHLLGKWGEDPWVQMWGLMHDAAEAYLGDAATPMKRQAFFMHEQGGVERPVSFARLERQVMATIAVSYNLPVPMPEVVKKADEHLLADEAIALIGNCADWDLPFPAGAGMAIDPVLPHDAELMFMHTWDTLYALVSRSHGAGVG